MDHNEIKRLVAGYNLFETLQARLQIVVVGGTSPSTIYKAFRVGPKTPLLELILNTAQSVIREHEAAVQSAVMVMSAT